MSLQPSLPQEFSSLVDMRGRPGSVSTAEFLRTIRAHVQHGVHIDPDIVGDLIFEFGLEPLSLEEKAEVFSLGIEHTKKMLPLTIQSNAYPNNGGLELACLMIRDWDQEEPVDTTGKIELRVDAEVLRSVNVQREIESLEALVSTCRDQAFRPENVLYTSRRSPGEQWQQLGARAVVLLQYLQPMTSPGLEDTSISPI